MTPVWESIIVPILAGPARRDFLPQRVLGTAFFVGIGRTFITAWHVREAVEAAVDQGDSVYLYIHGKPEPFTAINDFHRPHRLADIAFGLIEIGVESPLELSCDRYNFGSDVFTIGHPLDLMHIHEVFHTFSSPLRFFKGYVQSEVWASEDFLQSKHPVDHYQLSFPIPEGVSGAPLILSGTNTVIGVCVGTHDGTKIRRSPERDESAAMQHIDVERLGIAEFSTLIADRSTPWLGNEHRRQV